MLEELLKSYIVYMRDNSNTSNNTMNSYISDISGYENYLKEEGFKNISDTNKTIILKYLMELQKEGRATSTIARNISSIRSFYQYLLNKGYVHEDPTVNLKTPKIQKKIPDVLSIEEVEIILEQPDLNSFRGIRDRAMLELLYSTGIGINELIALNISDVDLNLEMIEIGSEIKRTVPVGSVALNYLEKYLKQFKSNCKLEALFLNKNKKRISRQGLWKNLKEYEKKSGLDKKVTPQILRQSFAVHMIENGADLKTVQKILGHSDITSTQIYALTSETKNIREIYKNTHPRA